MKKLTTLFIIAGLTGFVMMMAGFSGSTLKSSGGAPAGYTNSPADGKNCSQCMGGSAVNVNDWITSDVPATGYVPGSTYTISATATGSGNKGFQISPQDNAGNLIGTLTAGAGNKLVGSGKYVTHTAAQSAATYTWNFQWTAPPAGVGNVTFYGSIAVGKTNTKLSTLTLSQSTVGVSEMVLAGMKIYPNPASDRFTVSFASDRETSVSVELLDLSGRIITELGQDQVIPGLNEKTFSVDQPEGVYLLRVSTEGKSQTRKLVIL